ncbi:hypothetical protein FKW77_001645 [Venturia effusa]|uniref:Uncharacterized protein n=1 Tax=Venturia effusa TaxID=50376 RepID=A0A517L8N8_9PEZI|nr:hypothetical protein FKW77_001645 [Venturia effusa]
MLVQDLKQVHGSRAVAAIFMKGQSPRVPEELVIDVLKSILCQLTGKRYETESKPPTSEEKTEDLKKSICTAVQTFPRTFLVIDDLDSVGYRSVKLIEEVLDILQRHGLRTMITSRVARYPNLTWFCDAGGAHSIEVDCDLWFCSECYEQAERLEEKERENTLLDSFVTCTNCKEQSETERTCSENHKATTRLCRPYNYAQYDLDEIMGRAWEEEPSGFALWTIQHEHGLISRATSQDLWPNTEWPPLTPVGESLIADMKVVNDIMRHSEGNLSLAKLGLDNVCGANTLDSFRQIHDRLPRDVVSLFDSQVASVAGQAASVAKLGLSAIKLATRQRSGISMEDLQAMLDPLEWNNEVGPLDVQEILHASKGLLKESADGRFLEAYHDDLFPYATERYNEVLESLEI